MAKYQIIEFEIAGNQYGIDIKYINGIHKAHKLDIVPLPTFPEIVLGITSLRGSILPVLDLQRKLGFQKVSINQDTKLIILNVEGKELGVLVDEVTDILKPTEEEISDPSNLSFGKNHVISSIIKKDSHFVIALEMNKLLENEKVLSIDLENVYNHSK